MVPARRASLVALLLACSLALSACVGSSVALGTAESCKDSEVVLTDEVGDPYACLIDDDKVGLRTGGSQNRQWTATKVAVTDSGAMRVEFSLPDSSSPSTTDMVATLHVLRIPEGVDRNPLVIEQTFNGESGNRLELPLAS
jgi:hypothetical protein